ncbi:MAG: ribulokinase [Verrucomicrobiota bacterium]
MKKYALGLDYGTNSCRSLIVDLDGGRELADYVFNYPTGEAGVVIDPKDPNVARQHPQDYIDGCIETVREALKIARSQEPDFSPDQIIGIGVDTTGSTPIPVDEQGVALATQDRYKDNPDAMAWLWKDHTSHAEAALITETAARMRPKYLAKSGGTYSSEWFWSKVLHLKNVNEEVFNASFSFVELCDYVPGLLTGITDPLTMKRGICAAGHKAMYCDEWDGLPDKEFLAELDPALADLRDRLFDKAYTSDVAAGGLCEEWAEKLGLKPGTSVAVGAFDAHMGGVGSGIRAGTLVKILGTSTCDMMVSPNDQPLEDIVGVCGIVDGSILPGYYGIEAGQSAVGDIFLWFVNNLVPESYGSTMDEKFENLANRAAEQKTGAHGLLALDWNNGNRTVLVDVRLSGLLLGQTLHTKPHEIYQALIEATAYGALTIINRIESYGVKVEQIVNCGGIAGKNELLMQIYADVTGRPMKVSRSDQTCALGAAIFGAVSAGPDVSGFNNMLEAQDATCGLRDEVYEPIPENHEVYKKLFALYSDLHDSFGTETWSGKLNHVMKDLIDIRQAQR